MKDKIEKILLYLGISPSQFADELGVQRSGISHILSERNKPSLEFIQKVLVRYKEINPEWLMTGKGEMLRVSVQRSLFSDTTEPITIHQPNIPELEINSSDTISDEQQINKLTTNTSVSENHVNPHESNTEATLNIDSFLGVNNKEIEKIVLFYKDKTFSVYKPE
jgi:transcriptional regulator with XRE-family HTH domain